MTYIDQSNGLKEEIAHKRVFELEHGFESDEGTILKLRKELSEGVRREFNKIEELNKRNVALAAEAARAWSEVQKVEAAKSELQLSMVKWKSQAQTSEKEYKLKQTHLHANYERQLDELKQTLSQLQKDVDRDKGLSNKNCQTLKEEIQLKAEKISCLEEETTRLLNDNHAVKLALQQEEKIRNELSKDMRKLQEVNKTLEEELVKNRARLNYAKSTEDVLKNDTNAVKERVLMLEESLEAERLSHLQTKSMTGQLELKIKDLEGALAIEKTNKSEATSAVNRVSVQLRSVEKLRSDDLLKLKKSKDLHQKLQKECEQLKSSLSSELSDKKELMKTFSSQVEDQQTSCNHLKNDLAKVRKKLVNVESSYSNSLKEINQLVEVFTTNKPTDNANENNNALKCTGGKSIKTGTKKDLSSNDLYKKLGILRSTLDSYKKQSRYSKLELQKSKSNVVAHAKEIESLNQQLSAKDKSISDLQKNQDKIIKDRKKLQTDLNDLEQVMSSMSVELKSYTTSHSKEKLLSRNLGDLMKQQKKRFEAENDDKLLFLRSFYDRLTSILPSTKSSISSNQSWHDICSDISEQITRINIHISSLQHAVDQVRSDLTTKEEETSQLRQLYEEDVADLRNQIQQRESDYHRKIMDVERGYQQSIAKYQDEELQRLKLHRDTNEMAELYSRVKQVTNDNASLLTACILLSGAYFDIKIRNQSLSKQRNLLQSMINSWLASKCKLRLFVTTLNDQLLENPQELANQRCLLKFRVAVIAVIAANRLHFLSLSSNHLRIYNSSKSPSNLSLMYVSQRPVEHRKFAGLASIQGTDRKRDTNLDIGKNLYNWLSSNDLQAAILTSMADIQLSMLQANSTDPNFDKLIPSVRVSSERLITRLGSFYRTNRDSAFSTSRRNLAHYLNRSLHGLQKSLPLKDRNSIFSFHELTDSLQSHLIGLTHRLEKSEKEKHIAVQKTDSIAVLKHDLARSNEEIVNLQQKLAKFEETVHSTNSQGVSFTNNGDR